MIAQKEGDVKGKGAPYYGLLLYTVLFYSQIGDRIPVLAAFRLEFIVGSILLACVAYKIIRGEVTLSENRLHVAAIFFIGAVVISIPFAFVKTRALEMFIRMFKLFSIYLMIVSFIDTEEKLKGYIYVYLGMTTLLFIEPFILSLQGKGFVYNNHMWRLAGTTNYFGHPNQLGGMTSANLPFIYYYMKQERQWMRKVFLFILILISLRVIMLTQSRTAFLGVFVFAFVVWFTSKKKFISMFAIIVSFFLLWQFSPDQTRRRFLTFFQIEKAIETDRQNFSDDENRELGSISSRWELNKRTLEAFFENPIVGVGADCFASYSFHKWGVWFPAHNTYLQALAEIGVIGFGALSFVIIMTFRNLRQSNRMLGATNDQNGFLGTMISAVTAYLVLRIAVSFFGLELYDNYWWNAAGLSLVLSRIAMLKNPSKTTKEYRNDEA